MHMLESFAACPCMGAAIVVATLLRCGFHIIACGVHRIDLGPSYQANSSHEGQPVAPITLKTMPCSTYMEWYLVS